MDPRRLLRWNYIGRMILAAAIFLAAVSNWFRPGVEKPSLLIASLSFALTTAVTVASFAFSDIYRRPLRANFLYSQSIFDNLLVTSTFDGAPSTDRRCLATS